MGLDATKFLCGCIITERSQNKPMVFFNKEEMWQKILELGEAEYKRDKTLQVYAHNHAYDFYGYAPLTDRNIKWFSHSPFINAYCKEVEDLDTGSKYKKEYIKFLDTMSLYKMKLEEMAKINGMEKSPTPDCLKKGIMPTKKEMKKIVEYMIQDTRIVLKTILNLKQKLAQEEIVVKRLFTINQVAINYMITTLRKEEANSHMFWNPKIGVVHRTFRREEIHAAYRGGRVQAFQTGKHRGVTSIDINSLYPWCATQIDFPLLSSERKTWKSKEPEFIMKEEEIGIARCIVKNEKCQLGLLPIRTPTGSYYPGVGKVLIGTWTFEELRLALKEGYKILDYEWKVTWQKAPNNPLKAYMEKLYEKRMGAESPEDKYFYKQMMNSGIGKLAQNNKEYEIIIDNVEKHEEYLEKNYKMMRGIEYNYVYQKELPRQVKPYYAPIIPAQINAKGRTTLYKFLKEIKEEDRVYCDTDSGVIKNFEKYEKKLKIGMGLGEWKIEKQDVDCEVIARKTYQLDDQIKISGIHKTPELAEQFKEGVVKNMKMLTIKNTLDETKMGQFEEETRDLKEQAKNHKKIQEELEQQEIFIDEDIEDISQFVPIITQVIHV